MTKTEYNERARQIAVTLDKETADANQEHNRKLGSIRTAYREAMRALDNEFTADGGKLEER